MTITPAMVIAALGAVVVIVIAKSQRREYAGY